jgi:hypothetical protein
MDGGKFVAKSSSISVEDAASAWDMVMMGLSKVTSDRNVVLTINVHIPLNDDNGSSLVGTLQLGELTLPSADERMTRNISTLHDIVRGLVDKSYSGSVQYDNSLLTNLLQPAFGGNTLFFPFIFFSFLMCLC